MDLESKIAALEEKLSEVLSALAEKSAIIEAQALEIDRLKSLLSQQSVRATSRNSHLPPSKDLGRGNTAKKNQSLREKSDRPVGGQKGHKGHNLKMSEAPDVVRELYPDYCNNCGQSLAGKEREFMGRRQVVDIPPIHPVTTEYRQYRTQCSCGHCQRSSYPEGVGHPIQYGPNIQSLVVYQNVYQYMPFHRLQEFFQKVMGLSIGKGTMENMLRRTAKKAEPAYEGLRKCVEVSFFVGSDETGGRVNGKKNWFWVWQTALVTYIVAACSRSKQVIADTFPEGLPNSIVCSDRLAAQLSTVSKGSQLCLVHLLRDLNYLIEKEETDWAGQFKRLLMDALQLKREQGEYAEEDERAKEIEERADALLKPTFEERQWAKERQEKTMTFYRAMAKLRHALFPFLYHAEVLPDNNRSERAVRPIKVKMKISGQFKSLQNEFAILRSVIDSAIKNGQPPFDAIKAIVNIPV